MITWSKYCHFSAESVEYIMTSDNGVVNYPYQLIVHFKSSKSYTISYATADARDSAIKDLVRQIERERNADIEKIISLLYQLRSNTERLDKRQLRIWRQLRDLLNGKTEEVTVDDDLSDN